MSTATRQVRIARTVIEAPDIRSFELVAEDGSLVPFSAGAHIDVHVGGVVRQYSLCNDPRERQRYVIGVLKDAASRGGSAAMHSLETGQTLAISDPKNHFARVHDARHSLLFAGGIGITPILCMAQRLATVNASFDLHYCARSSGRAAFARHIRESSFADRAAFHYDDGPEAQKLRAAEAIGAPEEGKHLYVCGPTGFMDWILGTARDLGWPEARLHRESRGHDEGRQLRGSDRVVGCGDSRGRRSDGRCRAVLRRHPRAHVLRARRLRHVPDARHRRHARAP